MTSQTLARSRKGAETRARLLQAARSVFERRGFLDARVSDIADQARVSHGSFYHYFDSKEQVFRELAEAQEAMLTAPPAFDGEAGGDGTEMTDYDRILRANRVYLRRYYDNSRLMSLVEEVSRYDAVVYAARSRRQRHFAQRAATSIRRLQRANAADISIDPEIAAVALGSMVARFAELWLAADWSRYDFDHAAEQLSRLWANAIGVEVPAATGGC